MPPPKKPKNGPTTVEQFLSNEELQVLGKDKRMVRRDGSEGARGDRNVTDGSSLDIDRVCSGDESNPESVPPGDSHLSNRAQRDAGISEHAEQHSPINPQEKAITGSENETGFSELRADASSTADCPKEPSRLVCTSPVVPSNERHPRPNPIQAPIASGGRSILQRLFTAPPSERINTDNGSSFHNDLSQSHDLDSELVGQVETFSSDVKRAGFDYRFATSSTLTSLVTMPVWIPLNQSQPVRPPGLQLHLQSSSNLHTKGPQLAASYSILQQQRQQHQQQQRRQQQHLDRCSILASLFSSHLSSGPTEHSASLGDETCLLKSSPSGQGGSCAPFYLSNLIGSPSAKHTSSVPSGSASGVISSTQRTDSAHVYLHPAFKLPPSATSNIRTMNSTSSLSLLALGDSCLSGLPRHNNAKTIPPQTSPLKPHHRQTQATRRGSSLYSNSNSSGSNNSSSYLLSSDSASENANRDGFHLLDLSLKNKQSEDVSLSSQHNTLTSPLGKSSILTALIKESPVDVMTTSLRSAGNTVAESDESNSFISVISPVSTPSLDRPLSESSDRRATAVGKPPSSSLVDLAGLLSTPAGTAMNPAFSPIAVKEEFGLSPLPYDLLPCKIERLLHGAGPESRRHRGPYQHSSQVYSHRTGLHDNMGRLLLLLVVCFHLCIPPTEGETTIPPTTSSDASSTDTAPSTDTTFVSGHTTESTAALNTDTSTASVGNTDSSINNDTTASVKDNTDSSTDTITASVTNTDFSQNTDTTASVTNTDSSQNTDTTTASVTNTDSSQNTDTTTASVTNTDSSQSTDTSTNSSIIIIPNPGADTTTASVTNTDSSQNTDTTTASITNTDSSQNTDTTTASVTNTDSSQSTDTSTNSSIIIIPNPGADTTTASVTNTDSSQNTDTTTASVTNTDSSQSTDTSTNSSIIIIPNPGADTTTASVTNTDSSQNTDTTTASVTNTDSSQSTDTSTNSSIIIIPNPGADTTTASVTNTDSSQNTDTTTASVTNTDSSQSTDTSTNSSIIIIPNPGADTTTASVTNTDSSQNTDTTTASVTNTDSSQSTDTSTNSSIIIIPNPGADTTTASVTNTDSSQNTDTTTASVTNTDSSQSTDTSTNSSIIIIPNPGADTTTASVTNTDSSQNTDTTTASVTNTDSSQNTDTTTASVTNTDSSQSTDTSTNSSIIIIPNPGADTTTASVTNTDSSQNTDTTTASVTNTDSSQSTDTSTNSSIIIIPNPGADTTTASVTNTDSSQNTDTTTASITNTDSSQNTDTTTASVTNTDSSQSTDTSTNSSIIIIPNPGADTTTASVTNTDSSQNTDTTTASITNTDSSQNTDTTTASVTNTDSSQSTDTSTNSSIIIIPNPGADTTTASVTNTDSSQATDTTTASVTDMSTASSQGTESTASSEAVTEFTTLFPETISTDNSSTTENLTDSSTATSPPPTTTAAIITTTETPSFDLEHDKDTAMYILELTVSPENDSHIQYTNTSLTLEDLKAMLVPKFQTFTSAADLIRNSSEPSSYSLRVSEPSSYSLRVIILYRLLTNNTEALKANFEQALRDIDSLSYLNIPDENITFSAITEFLTMTQDICQARYVCPLGFRCNSQGCAHMCNNSFCNGHGMCNVAVDANANAQPICQCDSEYDTEYTGDQCQYSRRGRLQIIAILAAVLGTACVIFIIIIIIMCVRMNRHRASNYTLSGAAYVNSAYDGYIK